MSTLVGGRGLALTAAIVAIGAIVAGVILYTSSSEASEVDLTTAELVPADAGVYAAVNTDLTSSQWLSAFDLVGRLGTDDPEGELRDSIEEEDLDYDADFAPFLGGNAAVYLKGFEFATFDVSGAVIVRAADAERALEVLLEENDDYEEDEYEGVAIYINPDQQLYATRIGEHIVIGINQESLEEVIDVSLGEEPSLASVDEFIQLRDELTKNFLAFAYISAEELGGDLQLDDQVLEDALDESGASELVFEPMAWAVAAAGDAFELHAASLGESGFASPALEPRESRFTELVPAETALYFSTTGIAQIWEDVLAESEDEIDDAIAEDGTYDSLDEALEEAGAEIGLESIEDLLPLFVGETAFAAWSPTNDEDDFSFAFFSEVDDEEEALDLIETVAASDGTEVTEDEIEGTDVLLFEDEEGELLGAAALDGYLLIGTVDALEAVLAGPEETLADREIYRTAVDQTPTSLGTYAFFSLRDILRFTDAGMPPELDEAEEVLEAVILNFVEQNGIVRASGVLTVADE